MRTSADSETIAGRHRRTDRQRRSDVAIAMDDKKYRAIAEFAVELIRRWWKYLGRELYPNAKDIFITADGGGSNDSRNRLWKFCLQEFANESGLTIHVSHFPPGTSKWNKIEHRLFNHISMYGKGQPLTSRDIINLIGQTTSQTGLKVYAMEDHNIYPTKRKITDQQLNALNIHHKK